MNRLLEQNTRRQAAREVIETGVLAKSTLDVYKRQILIRSCAFWSW